MELNKTKYGYQPRSNIYVDDLKLYVANNNQLTGLINTVTDI